MSPLTQTLIEFTQLFVRMKLPYVVMGGLAVRAYGIPRATYDIDFTITIERERLKELYDAVETLGYAVPEAYTAGWVDAVGGMPLVKFQIFVEDNGIDIDVFLAETEFQQSVVSRRRREELDGAVLFLVSPEDLVLLKLLANRPRDIADVFDVLFIQGELDGLYLREWATRLNISDRLTKVLAGPPSV